MFFPTLRAPQTRSHGVDARPNGYTSTVNTDSKPSPPPEPAKPDPEVPGGPAATPPTPEGREAVLEEGEEA